MRAGIITKSVKALALTAGGFLATATLAVSAAPAPTVTAPIIATATYAVTYTCTGGPGCAMGTGYKHTYTINIDTRGLLKGTGVQDDYPSVTEALTGSLAYGGLTRTMAMNFVSTYTGYLAGYTVTENGSMDPVGGALSGTASSGMPGNTDATFSVSGTRTNLTIVTTIGGGGNDENDDVNAVNNNPPGKHDADKAKPAPKPTVKPADNRGGQREENASAGARQAGRSD
ncbi:MAG TPA: hypothetical protein VG104_04860 [Candidatus Dormibacteraeota bacterium]|jgi:hypothetical protein|nr:hypothetical protein [Candidatus Dormibacteraeota bacterium]